jgi:predicted SprT family Zn-dependent metalloprotease
MSPDEAQELALELMGEHGLTVGGWNFAFDRAARRFGSCSHRRKVISLSRRLTELNDRAEVRNTLLHEIAHALLPPATGHRRAWRDLAVSIGCDGRRCHAALTEPRWVATCPACGRRSKYHRRRTRLACARCCRGVYDPRYRFTWEPAGRDGE